jgi:threonine/homoserine/homoserine lactone efflux protein
MVEAVLSGIPLGIFLSFLIGPVFFVLLETSAVKGFRAAFVLDLGVVSADIIFIGIAYFSSYRLIKRIQDDPSIFIFGGVLMITYGLISYLKLKKAVKTKDTDVVVVEFIKKNYFNLFIKGFLLNSINVGVLLFWFLILITIGPKLDLEPSKMAVFFLTVIATYLLVDIGKILLAKQLRHKLTPEIIIKIKKGISILLIIFGLTIMFQGWFPSDQKMVIKALEKID